MQLVSVPISSFYIYDTPLSVSTTSIGIATGGKSQTGASWKVHLSRWCFYICYTRDNYAGFNHSPYNREKFIKGGI